jgi:hypothetical protein
VLKRLARRQDEAKVAIEDEDPGSRQLAKSRHCGIIGTHRHLIPVNTQAIVRHQTTFLMGLGTTRRQR